MDLRIVFVSDLHSDIAQYEQLMSLVEAVAPEALILGGDHFAYSTEPGPQLEFAEGFLRPFFRSLPCSVFWISGNVDWPDAVKYLEKLSDEMPNLEKLTLDPLNVSGKLDVIGYPFIPLSPFRIKHWERRDLATDKAEIPEPSFTSVVGQSPWRIPKEFLESLPSIEEEFRPDRRASVWVVHTPPYSAYLDVIRSKNDIISDDKGAEQTRWMHVGSKAIWRSIEQLQPTLTLHGHIHEAPLVSGRWIERIGNTIAVNPGRGDQLHAIVADIGADGSILSLRHTVFGDADYE